MASQSEIVVRFAGEGGQGVVTAAEILARAVSSVGFHSLTFATFPSQILGGPTWTQARLSRTPVLSPGDTIDILVAFNSQAYDEHRPEVREGGVILLDPSVTPDLADVAHRCITVPFDDLAKQTGEARAANMVVMGGLSHLINRGPRPVQGVRLAPVRRPRGSRRSQPYGVGPRLRAPCRGRTNRRPWRPGAPRLRSALHQGQRGARHRGHARGDRLLPSAIRSPRRPPSSCSWSAT